VSTERFSGCKLALVHRGTVLTYTRDRKVGIPYPGLLDLPGGGREGRESPEQCVLRELAEEFGLRLPAERLLYRRRYELPAGQGHAWFFAGLLHAGEIASIAFGDEGSHWQLIAIEDFLSHPMAIPHLRDRVREFLAQSGAAGYISV
jgi:8-oxo-dGTP diphosphatase